MRSANVVKNVGATHTGVPSSSWVHSGHACQLHLNKKSYQELLLKNDVIRT